MAEFFARQLTGVECGGKNCAAAAAAMGLAAGSGNRLRLTAAQVRKEAGDQCGHKACRRLGRPSCVPDEHSPSGGLFISDVIRVYKRHAIKIDYGNPIGRRRKPETLAAKLDAGNGAVLLGQYAGLPKEFRRGTFAGGHSAWVHDHHPDKTVCWHDPLRSEPIRIPIAAAIDYWQAPGPTKGSAGFVRIEEEGMPGLGFKIIRNTKGTAIVKSDSPHALIRVRDEVRVQVPAGEHREVIAVVQLLQKLDKVGGNRIDGYLIGKTPKEKANVEAAFMLATDVDFTPDP